MGSQIKYRIGGVAQKLVAPSESTARINISRRPDSSRSPVQADPAARGAARLQLARQGRPAGWRTGEQANMATPRLTRLRFVFVCPSLSSTSPLLQPPGANFKLAPKQQRQRRQQQQQQTCDYKFKFFKFNS